MDLTCVATNYSLDTANKKATEAARKDCLLELIGNVIASRRLLTKDLQLFVPELTAKQVSYIRQGMRSACSLDRLELLARGLGIATGTYDPCRAVAA